MTDAAAWHSYHHSMIGVHGARLHVVTAGAGPVLVLVAGFPQSGYAWRRVVPFLEHDFTVVVVDLPGQGDSDVPLDGYDTRTTSHRLHAALAELGHDRYTYVGHDIGAWTGFAYAHEFGSELDGLVLIDANIPGVTLPAAIELGPDNWRSFHFLFNAIPDLPEALLAGRERVLIEWFLHGKTASAPATFTPDDLDEYERVYARPGGMRGMLGYYRAVLTDMTQNEEYARTPLAMPVLALGGDAGSAPDLFERMRPLAARLDGGLVPDTGHYIPEEQPEALAARIADFVRNTRSGSA